MPETLVETTRKFLQASWRRLVMLNFCVPVEELIPLAPNGVEIDTYDDQAYVSIVGFSFEDTRIGVLPACGHSRFAEVNLRYYVRRRVGQEVRRGVVFVQEIVARPLVAWLARSLYGENYVVRKMPALSANESCAGEQKRFQYQWHSRSGSLCTVMGTTSTPWALPQPGSLEEFIVEHYWGYSTRRGRTWEYRVEHPPWQVAPVQDYQWQCDAVEEYGEPWSRWLDSPASALLADGSAVTVYRGVPIQ